MPPPSADAPFSRVAGHRSIFCMKQRRHAIAFFERASRPAQSLPQRQRHPKAEPWGACSFGLYTPSTTM